MKRLWFAVPLFLLGCPTPSDSDTTETDTEEPGTGLPDGDYLMGIALAPVGDLLVPFQASLTSEVSDDGSALFTDMTFRVADADFNLSDVLTTAQDITISEWGTFEVPIVITVPGEFSPTLSPVDITSTLNGTIVDENFFCGDVTGKIDTFDVDLEGSTFGSVPWEQRADGPAASCDDDRNATIARIDASDCPTLVAGSNTSFPSGDNSRSLEVRLPDNYNSETSWPLVFGWHGFSSTADDFLSDDLVAAANNHDAILIAPQGLDNGGQTSLDPFSDERRNLDLAFFDDILTCATASFNIDQSKIFTTGMSNGGLLSGLLLARRASVLAAAAPLSGGIGVAFAEDHKPIPSLVVWGGETDEAYEQDFHLLAEAMIEKLTDRDHFLITCNHELGHEIPEGGWQWVFDFLMAHSTESTDSVFAAGITETFPDYCAITQAAQ